MCGLLFVKRFENVPVRRMIERKYRTQKTRGTEGYGLVGLTRGNITDYFRCETEGEMIPKLDTIMAEEMFFHHRNPTSTLNFTECAQPLLVSHDSLKYDYLVAHNGVIRNSEILRKGHEALGYVYRTDVTQKWVTKEGKEYPGVTEYNDSESLAIQLAIDLDGERKGVSEVEGSVAFICLQFEKAAPYKAVNLFWGRNYSSPLLFEEESYYFSLQSEGDGKVVKEHILNYYNYADHKFYEKDYRVGVAYYPASNYGGHHTSLPAPREYTEYTPVLDPYANIPIIGDTSSAEDCLEAILDLESEIKSISITLEKSGLEEKTKLYLVEREAVLKDEMAIIERKWGIITIGEYTTSELSQRNRQTA